MAMNFIYLTLQILACLEVVVALTWLRNDHLACAFDEKRGKIRSLTYIPSEHVLISDSKVFELQFVNEDGTISIDSGSYPMKVSQRHNDGATLTWKEMNISSTAHSKNWALVTVNMFVKLEQASLECDLDVEVIKTSGSELGLWQSSILAFTKEGVDQDGDLFFPAGIGRTFNHPTSENSATSGYIYAVYPSGGASMQYMAVATDESYSSSNGEATSTGLYVAAHDKKGYIKSFTYYHLDVMDTNVLNITTMPENAGTPFSKWRMPFPVVFAACPGINHSEGYPLWYQAAEMYRRFIFSDGGGGIAPWVRGKKIAERIPEWYKATSFWLNSHWQCNDVFNSTGGDPDTVVKLATRVAAVLGEPTLALHWYEWGAYAFDTNYPDYFPAKRGFVDAISGLRRGRNPIRTFPYTNGRIFDQHSAAYVQDDGAQYCSKQYPTPRFLKTGKDRDPPVILTESYGSDATFCVASPQSSYWQSKVSGVTGRLLEQEHVDGVYIDQVGASPPMACWDGDSEVMDHPNGGGTYWTQGYLETLRRIDESKNRGAGGEQAPIITEDCAEPYMGVLQGNLVLTSFRASLAQQSIYSSAAAECPQAYKRLTPAYAAVYGGHFIAAGAEWFRSDFNDHDWLCGKLASQFTSGVVMGWMALSGLDYRGDQKCGPMGVADLILAPEHRPAISYLKLLASARREALPWLLGGRMGAPPKLNPAPPVLTQDVRSKGGGLPLLDFDSVSSSSWLIDEDEGANGDKGTILVLITNNVLQERYVGTATVRADAAQEYEVCSKLLLIATDTDATSSGSEWLQRNSSGTGTGVIVEVDIPPRSVVLVKLSPGA
jgi:hypothetical protein